MGGELEWVEWRVLEGIGGRRGEGRGEEMGVERRGCWRGEDVGEERRGCCRGEDVGKKRMLERRGCWRGKERKLC